MGAAISAAARLALANKAERPKKIEIIHELMDSGLRVVADVTTYVLDYGTVGGDSTIRRKSWAKPPFNPSFQVEDDNYLLPNHASSVWASFGTPPVDPRKCWVRLYVYVVLADGSLEVVKTWIGKIADYQVRLDGGIRSLDLVTEHPSAEALAAGITKESAGDVLVRGGSGY